MAIKLPTKLPNKKVLRPGLLATASIPLPLSQVNPRLLMGQYWWRQERQKAVEANNYRCWACGVHQRDAKEHQYLEAHEVFTVNYNKKRSRFKEVVALCHYCHSVVHIKRLLHMWLGGSKQVTIKKLKAVIQHGKIVLENGGVKLPYELAMADMVIRGLSETRIKQELTKRGYREGISIKLTDWNKWRMEFRGHKYPPKFKSHDELMRYYKNVNFTTD